MPGNMALRNIRIVACRIGTVIPELRRRWCHHHGGQVGIDRERVEIPDAAYDPPPAEQPVVPAMAPLTAAPAGKIVLVKAADLAMPSVVATMSACAAVAMHGVVATFIRDLR